MRNIFTANGLWFPNVDKETKTIFTVSPSHHLFSFATMLGPSPDWLSGLSRVDLCLPNCTWTESLTEHLYPFDAGTDSGISYNVKLFFLIYIIVLNFYPNPSHYNPWDKKIST